MKVCPQRETCPNVRTGISGWSILRYVAVVPHVCFSPPRKLLQHECPLCPDSRAFPAIVELEQHMRKQHELFCCKLCVKHLKASRGEWGRGEGQRGDLFLLKMWRTFPLTFQIFTYERKWYSRKDLARHRIHGDPDDTSHRGHPLCKFCDERYLDNDELLKHLRRDHYFCHFCDSDGAQEYYRSVTPADSQDWC